MKKFIKLISSFILIIIVFTINKINVFALSGKIELSSDKNQVNVNDIIKVTVKISEDGNSLGSWQANITHSSNLSLISGDENIVDVIGDTLLKEKEYELTYKAISSGEATINISDGKIIDYDSEEEISVNKNNIKVSIKGTEGSSPTRGSKNGFVNENGGTYYYINGVMQKGIYEIDGKYYHFGENSGQLKTGWSITLDLKEYYSDKNGVMQFGWVEADNQKYYITKEEGAYKGIYEIDGKMYHFGQNTKQLKTGWSITLDKKEYYSDKKGVVQLGFTTIDNNKYYFSKEEGEYKGIYEIDGKMYHFGQNSGQLKTGWSITLDLKEYYSDKNGVMQFGWVEADNQKYYITKEEGAYKGIYEIDGKMYHFGQNTKQLKTGWSITLDLKEYYSDKNGVMQFGWVEIDNQKYYITKEEGEYKGIYEIDGKMYHFGQNSGQLKTDWSITLDKKEYYSDKNGVMQFGWLEVDGNKYYVTKEEGAYKGVYEIDGKRYHFGQNTKQLKIGWSVTLDKKYYYSNSEGVIQTGMQTIDGIVYKFADDGVLQSGYQTINGKTYYYYNDGSLAKGVVKIQGERNYFDFTTGELLRRNVKAIIDVSYGQGTINWDQLWASGQIDGVILRIGYGTSTTDNPVQDSYFAYNIAAVKRLGIPYSVYIFGYAQTPFAAEKEATFVANTLRNYGATNLSMPIFYDAEISNWRGVDYNSTLYSNTITAFSNKLKSLGFNNVGVYGSYSWFTDGNGRLNSTTIRSYPLWVAQYYRKCSYTDPLIGWQYDNKGRLPGISTNVDMNIFF